MNQRTCPDCGKPIFDQSPGNVGAMKPFTSAMHTPARQRVVPGTNLTAIPSEAVLHRVGTPTAPWDLHINDRATTISRVCEVGIPVSDPTYLQLVSYRTFDACVFMMGAYYCPTFQGKVIPIQGQIESFIRSSWPTFGDWYDDMVGRPFAGNSPVYSIRNFLGGRAPDGGIAKWMADNSGAVRFVSQYQS
jgi:hypothetical protein